MRGRTVGLGVCAILAVVCSGAVLAAEKAAPADAKASFYAAWRTLGAPLPTGKNVSQAEARQKAREAAVAAMEAAVKADPRNSTYQATLAYCQLTAGQYRKAKQSIDAAIQRERTQPLLYLLRGRAEATLAQLDPAKASQAIKPAIEAFDRAAALDPTNSLALLQAVSVALDVDRVDLAEPRLKQALARPGLRLYQLPVPMDLEPKPVDSFRKWEQLQLTFWYEDPLPRLQNAGRGAIRLGDLKAKNGDYDAAYAYYQQGLEIGKQIARAEPRVFVTVISGLDVLEGAYQRLAGCAKAKQQVALQQSQQAKAQGQDTAKFDTDAAHWKMEGERWDGERGILQLGRTDLLAALQQHQAELQKQPPASLSEMLQRESQSMAWTLNGLGLTSDPNAKSPLNSQPRLPKTAPAAPKQ